MLHAVFELDSGSQTWIAGKTVASNSTVAGSTVRRCRPAPRPASEVVVGISTIFGLPGFPLARQHWVDSKEVGSAKMLLQHKGDGAAQTRFRGGIRRENAGRYPRRATAFHHLVDDRSHPVPRRSDIAHHRY